MASLLRMKLFALAFCTFFLVSTDLPNVSAAYLNGCLAYNVWGLPRHDCRLAHVEAKFMSTILRLQQNLSRAGSPDDDQVVKKIGNSGSTITFSLTKVGALLRPRSRPDAESFEGRCPPRDNWEGALVSDKVGVRICKERLMCCDAVTAPGLSPFTLNLFTCQVRCLLAVKVTIKLDVMEKPAREAFLSEYKSSPTTKEARCGESQGSAVHTFQCKLKGAEDDHNFPNEVEDCATCLEGYGGGCRLTASPPFAEGESEQPGEDEGEVLDNLSGMDPDGDAHAWDEGSGEDYPTESEWDYPGGDGPAEDPDLGGDALIGEPVEDPEEDYFHHEEDYSDSDGYSEDPERDDSESDDYSDSEGKISSEGDSPDVGEEGLDLEGETAETEDIKQNDLEEGLDLGGDGLEEDQLQTKDEDSEEGAHPPSSGPVAPSTSTPSPPPGPLPSTRSSPSPSPNPSASVLTPSSSPTSTPLPPPSPAQEPRAAGAFAGSSEDSATAAIAGSAGEGPPGASSASAFSFNTAASR